MNYKIKKHALLAALLFLFFPNVHIVFAEQLAAKDLDQGFSIPKEQLILLDKKVITDNEDETIQPPFGFTWGNSIKEAQRTICSIDGVKKVEFPNFFVIGNKTYERDDFCKKHVSFFSTRWSKNKDIIYKLNDLASFIYPRSYELEGFKNKRVIDRNLSITFWPVAIKQVEHAMTLYFGTNNRRFDYIYHFLQNKDRTPESITLKLYDGDTEFFTCSALSMVEVYAIDEDLGGAVAKEISSVLLEKYKKKTNVSYSFDHLRASLNGTELEYIEPKSFLTYKAGIYLDERYKGCYDNFLKRFIKKDNDFSSTL